MNLRIRFNNLCWYVVGFIIDPLGLNDRMMKTIDTDDGGIHRLRLIHSLDIQTLR